MNKSTAEVEAIVSRVVEKIAGTVENATPTSRRIPIPIEASARHVHLNADALERLFGPGASLEKIRDLSQPGEFLAEQRVKIVTQKGEIANVAVLGPLRNSVQVELSLTDCRALGVDAPVNVSGDLSGAGDAFIVGSAGVIAAKGSVIAARAHAHLRPGDAETCGLRDGQTVSVEVAAKNSPRRVTFGGVVARVSDAFSPAVHIDLDEANACALGPDSLAYIVCGAESNGSCDRQEAAGPHTEKFSRARECCACDDKVLTESAAKKIVQSCDCRRITVGERTVLTPSARDIFFAAGWTVERRS